MHYKIKYRIFSLGLIAQGVKISRLHPKKGKTLDEIAYNLPTYINKKGTRKKETKKVYDGITSIKIFNIFHLE